MDIKHCLRILRQDRLPEKVRISLSSPYFVPMAHMENRAMEIGLIELTNLPLQLREIQQPPEKLWLRGTMPREGTKLLAVVGSRALTSYGREACEYLIKGLAGYPISIVSGLALGADACAHRAALSAGLHTIAIPGSGLSEDALYPRENLGLARDIVKASGALLSEHEPEHCARSYDFPSRNRIMVGLADAVLIVEAGERSGSLITARLAADYNRDLLCVPHRIKDRNSYGIHQFLRLGATLVAEPEHILEALGFEALEEAGSNGTRRSFELNESEAILFALLAESRSRDELIRGAGLPVHEALATLGTLELRGIISEKFGSWHRI
jgi:DNA processing protein